jgi:hypothetical protein
MEESTALIDKIIGRCVREADFAKRVLEDPRTALAEYQLNKPELDDFLALQRHASEANDGWTKLRRIHGG